MIRLRSVVFLVAFACLLTVSLPFCVPSVESKVLLPGGGEPPTDTGGGESADPDDIAINSLEVDNGLIGQGTFAFGDEHCTVIWTEEYACPKEERVANSRAGNAQLLLFVLRAARQFAFVL
jgi:hypothetical protein